MRHLTETLIPPPGFDGARTASGRDFHSSAAIEFHYENRGQYVIGTSGIAATAPEKNIALARLRMIRGLQALRAAIDEAIADCLDAS